MRVTTPNMPDLIVPVSGKVIIGRAAEHQISLPADTAVSRDHARIMLDAGGCMVEDTESRNGTFISRSGRTVRVTGATLLLHGDVIIIGNSRLVFEAPELLVHPPDSAAEGDQGSTHIGLNLPRPRP
jgi:pSer/pThr/pTyr-binding forkhead associated (FHA) protein